MQGKLQSVHPGQMTAAPIETSFAAPAGRRPSLMVLLSLNTFGVGSHILPRAADRKRCAVTAALPSSPHPHCARGTFLKIVSSVVLSGFIEPADKLSLKRLPGLLERSGNYKENELHP